MLNFRMNAQNLISNAIRASSVGSRGAEVEGQTYFIEFGPLQGPTLRHERNPQTKTCQSTRVPAFYKKNFFLISPLSFLSLSPYHLDRLFNFERSILFFLLFIGTRFDFIPRKAVELLIGTLAFQSLYFALLGFPQCSLFIFGGNIHNADF